MPAPRFLNNIPTRDDLADNAIFLPAGRDAAGWFADHRVALLDRVGVNGWAIVRDVPIRTAEDFAAAISGLEVPPAHHYGDLPFHPETEHVFQTTAYPKTEEILFHNEAAHQRSCPRYLFFCCRTPAVSGGETPISDGVAALQNLPGDVRARLCDAGLLYKRRFMPGLDVDWRTVFGTDDRAAVVARCSAEGIKAEWQEEDALAIATRVPAVAPSLGGAPALCHQVGLFHPFFLPHEIRTLMQQSFGPESLPRDVVLGDGTPLSDTQAWTLHEASRKNAFVFSWRRGDVLILDNYRMAHGRRSYTGERSHFVIMSTLERRDMTPPAT